ncbi:MAG: DUF4430 domain-containing protein [Clostridia bacterium]|nr:DUF4430 domain-containing protein [Clostridia bacterium]
MDQRKKRIVLLVVLTVVLAALIAGGLLLYHHYKDEPVEGKKAITVVVNHPDGSQNTFTYHTDAEYLGEVLLAEGLISGSEGEYGLFVDTVDGVYADSAQGEYWMLFIDGEYAPTGVDSTVIEDGDAFEWTIEVYN